jgi:hypothetical protein
MWRRTPGSWPNLTIEDENEDYESRKAQAHAEVSGLMRASMKYQVQKISLKVPFGFMTMPLHHFPNLTSVDIFTRASDNELHQLVRLLLDTTMQQNRTLNIMLELDESLECPKFVTDGGLSHLSELQGSLLKLNLLFCEKITDASLEHVSRLTSLQTLELLFCRQLTNTGLRHLISLHSLQTLVLSEVTDIGLEHLRGLVNLQCLDLCGAEKLTDRGLFHLRSLSKLQNVGITRGCCITDVGLSALLELRELRLRGGPIRGEYLHEIGILRAEGLRRLELVYCLRITDESLHHLRGWSALRALDLTGCAQVTNEGLRHLAELTSLEKLTLSACDKVSDPGLAFLSGLRSLDYLDLRGTCVTKQGLVHVQKLNIRELYVDLEIESP